MTQRNWSWEAKQLLPHLAGMLGSGVTVQAGGGSMVAHALNSSTWHTGTLNESQAPWAVTDTVYDAHVANVNAHHAKQHAITDAAHHTIAGAPWSVVGVPTTANTLGVMVASADVSAGVAALLRSDATGALGLRYINAVGDLTLQPTGDVTLNPGGWVELANGKTLRTVAFASGFVGNGFRLDQGVGVAGQTSFEVDNLWVRGRMHVYELLIHQIRATNGSIFVSNTGKVTQVSGSGPYTLTTDPEHGFAVGDLIRAQRFTGTGVYQSNLQVTSVTNSKVFVATLSSGDAPEAGMDFVRLGSASDANRRGGLYLTADDSGAPYMDIFDGVSSFGAWGTDGVIKTRLGKLDGLGLAGSYTNEYGLYAGNGTTDADPYIRLSNKTNRLNNLPMEWWSGGAKIIGITATDGINVAVGSSWEAVRAYTFSSTSGVVSGMYGLNNWLRLHANSVGNKHPAVTLEAVGSGGYQGTVQLDVYGNAHTYLHLSATAGTIASDGNWTHSGYFDVTGVVSGASGAFAGALTASNGGLGMSQSGAYAGYSIMTPNSGWARGFFFRTIGEVLLGGFGGYGSVNTLSYLWIGNAYNDFSIRTYPTTGNTDITGNLTVGYSLDVVGSYRRNGVTGCIFVPMTPTNLTDTGSTLWNGVSRAAGTYTFDVNSAANGSVPAEAVAVAVCGTFTWTNANNATYATIQETSQPYSIVARATASAIGIDVTGVVKINSSGQFTVTIVNATSNTSLLRIVGYYI